MGRLSAALGYWRAARTVKFSADPERINRRDYICINPAYGRDQQFIPASCTLDPLRKRIFVVDARVPQQDVSGYEYVIWGTAPASAGRIAVRTREGRVQATTFKVGPHLSARVGSKTPFEVFVAELPTEFACEAITVEAIGASPTNADRSMVGRAKLCP
jgi:hypothetical protein